MKSYNIIELQIKRKTLFTQISEYVRGDALSKDIYTVELELFHMLLELGLTLLREVVERHGDGKVDSPIIRDQNVLPFHMVKPTSYLSIFGEIEIRRAYYWERGEKGFFPLDATLNLPERKYSYLLEKWVQADIAEEPYEKAVSRYTELLTIPVSKLGQENVAREISVAFNAFYQQKPPFDFEIEGDIIGVEADGKGVRMISSEREENTEEKIPGPRRSKGEKSGGLRREAVSTADFTFNPEPRTPEEIANMLMKEVPKEKELHLKEERRQRHKSGESEPRQALNVQVAATMYGKQTAFEGLAERVLKRDPSETKPIVALMDGDPSLEKELSAVFRAQNQYHRIIAVILDIMHAMAYVWEVGTVLHGEKGSKRHGWVKKHALAVLNQRAVIKNGDWDDYWDFHMDKEHKRLYETPEILMETA